MHPRRRLWLKNRRDLQQEAPAVPVPAPVVEEAPAAVVEEVVEAPPVVEKPKKAPLKAKKLASKAEPAPRKRAKKASSSQSKK